MSRHISSDLILPLFPWRIRRISANHPDVLPIKAVTTSGNRPFSTHVQTIEDDSTESTSQWWADPCNGAISCHSIAGCARLPQVFGGDSSSGKPQVSSSQLPRRPALKSVQQSGDDYSFVDLHLCLQTYAASLPDTLHESGKDTRCFAYSTFHLLRTCTACQVACGMQVGMQ